MEEWLDNFFTPFLVTRIERRIKSLERELADARTNPGLAALTAGWEPPRP